MRDPAFVPIGNPDLIEKRSARVVPVPPGGVLDDYVPFYFCTHSLMLYNIHTGYNVKQVPQSHIVYLVSSVQQLQNGGSTFVFTDRHAYPRNANYSNDISDMKNLDWELIQSRDFRRDPNRPDKIERRAAELLVHRRMAVQLLAGVACYDEAARRTIADTAASMKVQIVVKVRQDWYF